MFGFSSGELLLIALIALLLFGNDKLPENMKKMIKGLNQAKKVAKDVQDSWHEVKIDVQRSIMLEEESNQIKQLINDSAVEDTNHIDIQGKQINHLVSQEDLDSHFSNFEKNQENNLVNASNIELSNNEDAHFPEHSYVSAKEYANSTHFVGPRL
ncbi:twin-arginine translocase TatA/TatE family subunit [Pigmentibacter sp. JX0631]|uniref:twin-arginine translocase TatA/TatE family subunit n=1 Tax=Pigmentibacter sp. JX0631 TaxID=2976982 RepID=UPI0024690E9E|nr:twin-arginine translocase TatA/TatE family subunit [Pigmentibacter sp. JX0631]WGL61492.1 twin-arginine translocase TatA/TatE family subunit [Pigmentibacter sp. JX0631]